MEFGQRVPEAFCLSEMQVTLYLIVLLHLCERAVIRQAIAAVRGWHNVIHWNES